jgi:hypothetical protein
LSVESNGIFNTRLHKIPRKLRLKIESPFQLADPFLYSDNRGVWCFYEVKSKKEKGYLRAINIDTRENYRLEILPGVHLSYPFVFNNEEKAYLIPETGELNEVSLYVEDNFPYEWLKTAVLLKGNYVDSHILFLNGVFYLFSTLKENSQYSLRLYYSTDLNGPYREHIKSPLHNGRRFGRSGGPIMRIDEKIYRFSQDCEIQYGKEVHMFEITKLTETEYEEVIVVENLIFNKFGHNLGGHHVCKIDHAVFKELWAVDFNFRDSYFQRFVNRFLQ